MKLDYKDLERIIKVVVATNGGAEFNKKFLKLYDNLDLIVIDEGDNISMKVIIKKEI